MAVFSHRRAYGFPPPSNFMIKKIGTSLIETKRLLLRPFFMDDAVDMFKNYTSDTNVTPYLSWKTHTDIQETRKYLMESIPKYSEGLRFCWAIVLKDIGEVIGSIDAKRIDETTETAVIGYCLGSAFWGREIMPEALLAVLRFLFEEVGFSCISALHAVENEKSGHVMQKVGMQKEGVLRRGTSSWDGKVYDAVRYSMIKEEWDMLYGNTGRTEPIGKNLYQSIPPEDSYVGINENKLRHILGVSRRAYEIAREEGKDEEFCRRMFVAGWLHDVGYEFCKELEEHPFLSAEMSLSVNPRVVNAILQHGQALGKYTDEERILNIADIQVDSNGRRVTAKDRLTDIAERYGENSKQYKTCVKVCQALSLIDV